MPAEVLRDPLALKLSLPGGTTTVIVIGDLPNAKLAADLTEGLAASVHPHGPLAKLTTVKSFTSTLRRMVRELAEGGFTGSAAELTRAVLGAFWLRSHYLVEYRTRTVLRAFDTRHRVLAEPVRQMVFGTNYTRPALNGPLPPYAPAEWNRLIDLCKQELRRLGEEQRAMVALAEGGRDPAVGGWSEANGAWLMLRMGPVTRTEVAAHLGITPDMFTKGHRGIERVRAGLFPSHKDAVPYMLLLAAWTGIVPDGLTGLEMPGIRWTGRQATLLSYTKGRTADESLVLSPRTSRLLEKWLQHNALLRRHAPAELAEHVWLVTRQGPLARASFEEYVMRGWVKAHDLRGDDGGLLRIDRRRLRTTFIAQRGQRHWSLRATVDPNHSPEVEGDHYLSAATPAQKAVVEEIARDAQGDLLRRASAPLVVDEADSAAGLPEEARRRGLAQGALAELLSGERDVFTGGCADHFAGLHGPKGQPCPARPWVCLLCPLALFAPRHLPNLLRLKAFFARQFRQMPREEFAAVFAPYTRRLSADILPRFEKAAVAAAQRNVGDEDAELPLRAAGDHVVSLLPAPAEPAVRSVFAGADIAATARLNWLGGCPRPRFEDDVWSFVGWADAPVQMKVTEKNVLFDRITHRPWRVVTKELALAWIATQDERVLALPRARRLPRHPRTIYARVYHLTFWLNWLHERRITTLAAVTQDHCEAFLREYGVVRDKKTGAVLRNKAGGSLRTVVSAMQDITDYGELLSADRHRPGFRPWGARSPRVVTGAPSRPQVVIKTEPLGDEVLRPLLTACLHLVDVLGPHIVDLRTQLQTERESWCNVEWSRHLRDGDRLAALVEEHLRTGQPLPRIEDFQLTKRLRLGWDPKDPLLTTNFQHLLRPTRHRDIHKALFAQARPLLEKAVAEVGTEYLWCRDPASAPRADTGESIPWSLPLSNRAADALIRIAGHACTVATSALTGMRSSELMELTVGCRRTDDADGTGLARHRLVSKVVKGRLWGGEIDDWVVIEEVVRVIALAEQLTDARPGQPLFGAFHGFESKGAMTWLRQWVASPAGRRMGLEPIPDEPVHPRRLRRTLSVEMAARPGGLLATKVHFKHLQVATSEGYAGRPGGAQAVFHHEWKKEEAKEKLRRTVEAYRQFEQGQMPAGPGVDALLASFRAVEKELADHEPSPAKVVTDRQIELLLKKKASVLHLSAANYCWFEDPTKALCLKLAGDRSAAAPLTGLCDSSRCQQATHHSVHRSVWQTAADNGAVLLASPRIPPAEKDRLRAEHERSTRVLEEIDTATRRAG